MQKQNAINYLAHLHKLEAKFSDDLLTLELKELVEHLRATFLKEYKGI